MLVNRGRNVLRLPIEEPRQLLTEALRKVQYPVLQSTPFDVKPAKLLRAAKELEFEGVIAKRKGSIYQPAKRSGIWLKYKINKSQELVIGGYTLGGNPFDALIVGCYDGPKFKYVAKVRAAHAVRPVLEFRTEKCPFDDLPEKRRTLYSLTRTEWAPDTHLRHASFVGLLNDKEPRPVSGNPKQPHFFSKKTQ